MLLLALGGVVLGFAFLLLSLLTDNAAWAWGCIVVCVVAAVLLVVDTVRRRRRPADDAPALDASPGSATAPAEPAAHPGESGAAADARPSSSADHRTPDERSADEHSVDRHSTDEQPAVVTQARSSGDEPTEVIPADRAAGHRAPDAASGGDAPTQQIPVVRDGGVSAASLLDGGGQVPAADTEPAVEDPTSQQGATAAASDAEVLVVDERPRFHVAGCPWLRDRETIALPAREAVDLGFSPCAVCRPVAALATPA